MQFRRNFLVSFIFFVMISFSAGWAMEGASRAAEESEESIVRTRFFSPETQKKVNKFFKTKIEKRFLRLLNRDPLKTEDDSSEKLILFQDISAHWMAIWSDIHTDKGGHRIWLSLLVDEGIITEAERKEENNAAQYEALCQELKTCFLRPEDFKTATFKSPSFFLKVIGIELASFAWLEWRNIIVEENRKVLSSVDSLYKVVADPSFSQNIREIPRILKQYKILFSQKQNVASKDPQEDRKMREEAEKVNHFIQSAFPGAHCSAVKMDSKSDEDRATLLQIINQSLEIIDQVNLFACFAHSSHLRSQKLGCFSLEAYFGDLNTFFKQYAESVSQWHDMLSSPDGDWTEEKIRKAGDKLVPVARIPELLQGEGSKVSKKHFDAAVAADLGLARGTEEVSTWSAWSFYKYIWSCYIEEPQVPYRVFSSDLPLVEECLNLFQCQHFKEQAREAHEKIKELKENVEAHIIKFGQLQQKKEAEIKGLKVQLAEQEAQLRKMNDTAREEKKGQDSRRLHALEASIAALEGQKQDLRLKLDTEKMRHKTEQEKSLKDQETQKLKQEQENAQIVKKLQEEGRREKQRLEDALSHGKEDLQKLEKKLKKEIEDLQKALAAQKTEYEKQLDAYKKSLAEKTASEASLKTQIQAPAAQPRQERDQEALSTISKVLGSFSEGQSLEAYLKVLKDRLEKGRAFEGSLTGVQKSLNDITQENISLKGDLQKAKDALAQEKREKEERPKAQVPHPKNQEEQTRLKQRIGEQQQEISYCRAHITDLMQQLGTYQQMQQMGAYQIMPVPHPYFPPHGAREGNGVRLSNGSWAPYP